MCGIVGIVSLAKEADKKLNRLDAAVQSLEKRGPDGAGSFLFKNVGLGHRRLAILDPNPESNQPFSSEDDRYTLCFNGEIYNFKELKSALINFGHSFKTSGDTEVVLKAFIQWGPKAFERFNGFFGLAIFDKKKEELTLARDRLSIKPLLIYSSEKTLAFASELKAFSALTLDLSIDYNSLFQYLQFSYIPPTNSIYKEVYKLKGGYFATIKTSSGTYKEQPFYTLPNVEKAASNYQKIGYEKSCEELKQKLELAVNKRLVSDVPLGTFLSGGIDSSIISSIAAKSISKLHTFSIGFPDQPFFDETHYAKLVAKKYQTAHTVIPLKENDLFEALEEFLDAIDEPFADTSALPVYLLSREVRKNITVALSGDGGDELLAGYNKHKAEWMISNMSFANQLIRIGQPIFNFLPQSRDGKISNKLRQLNRYANVLGLSPKERYWQLAAIHSKKSIADLVMPELISNKEYENRKEIFLSHFGKKSNLQEVLFADLNLVLVGDMLPKVDSMSMANGLEVRTPFLDHNFVEYCMSLPVEYKRNKNTGKRILQDAFRKDLPPELYHRSKQGFDIPLLKWLRTGLNKRIEKDILDNKFILDQGIFLPNKLKNLYAQLHSSNPAESPHLIWALLVFQSWWKKNLNIKG